MRLDSLVLIGQFAPLHNGHIALLRRALERADRVIVLIGSAGRARNSRHPWTAAEREQMIRAALPAESARILIRPLRDHLYNENAWIAAVQSAVRDALGADGGFYPEITDGCERAWNSRSRLATLRRILGLWNRSTYSNTSVFAASSVRYFVR